MIDRVTTHLGLPLPHEQNFLEDDCPRISQSLKKLDAHAAEVDASLKARVDDLAAHDRIFDDHAASLAQAAASIGALVNGQTVEVAAREEADAALAAKDAETAALVAALAARVAYLESHLYELGEIYFFSHPTLRPGFMPCYGGVIEGCADAFPQIWDYLQTEEGQLLCVTEADWQAAVTATWHTNADGTKVGWNGVGGCAKFVLDLDAGTLRMPDIRGCLPEAVGGPASPGMGMCQGDAIRNMSGSVGTNNVMIRRYDGLMRTTHDATQMYGYPNTTANTAAWGFDFNASRVVPTASVNRPRTFGMLPCAYLGIPR